MEMLANAEFLASNICRLLDLMEDEDAFYVVMERANGLDLFEEQRRENLTLGKFPDFVGEFFGEPDEELAVAR